MNSNCHCILCGSKEISLIEKIDANVLIDAYKTKLNITCEIDADYLSYLGCGQCGLKYFDPQVTGSKKFYDNLAGFDWYYMEKKFEFEVAAGYVKKGDNILEVGSGKGYFSEYVNNKNYTGLEFNNDVVKESRQNGINIINESVEEHAIKANEYDVVLSFQVLEHVIDPLSFLVSSTKCLRKNGLLIIGVPNHNGYLGEAVNNLLDMPPHHVSHWNINCFEYLADKLKMELLTAEYEPVADYHDKYVKKIKIENWIRDGFSIKRKLIDQRLVSRIISFLSKVLSIFVPINLANTQGHTLVVVLRKL